MPGKNTFGIVTSRNISNFHSFTLSRYSYLLLQNRNNNKPPPHLPLSVNVTVQLHGSYIPLKQNRVLILLSLSTNSSQRLLCKFLNVYKFYLACA